MKNRHAAAELVRLVTEQGRQIAELTAAVRDLLAVAAPGPGGRRSLSERPSAVRMRRFRSKVKRSPSPVASHVTAEVTASERPHRVKATPSPRASQVTPKVTPVPPPPVPSPFPLDPNLSPFIPLPLEKAEAKQQRGRPAAYWAFREGWEQLFEAETGAAYVWRADDGRAAVALLRSLSPTDALALASRLVARWRSSAPRSFERRRGLSVAELHRVGNELRGVARLVTKRCACDAPFCPGCTLTAEERRQADERERSEAMAATAAWEQKKKRARA